MQVEPGETHEEALARELREELGLVGATVGALVWSRDHVYEREGRATLYRERHYLVSVDGDCPSGPGVSSTSSDDRAFISSRLRNFRRLSHNFEVPVRPRDTSTGRCGK